MGHFTIIMIIKSAAILQSYWLDFADYKNLFAFFKVIIVKALSKLGTPKLFI